MRENEGKKDFTLWELCSARIFPSVLALYTICSVSAEMCIMPEHSDGWGIWVFLEVPSPVCVLHSFCSEWSYVFWEHGFSSTSTFWCKGLSPEKDVRMQILWQLKLLNALRQLSCIWRCPNTNSVLVPRQSVVKETFAFHRSVPGLLILPLGCVNSSCCNSCRSL